MARQFQKAAKVYAKTLLELAALRGGIDTLRADFESVLEVFAKTPGLERVLTLPMLSSEKKGVLVKPLADKGSDLLQRLLRLLEVKGRLALLPTIAETFIRIEEEARQIRRARVVSAIPLTAEQLEKLSAKLTLYSLGKTYILQNDVDPSLLAGFRIEEDGRVTDTSLRHKLDGLRQQLAAA
jgi:F-type H+-transporting ATPase subunit delta